MRFVDTSRIRSRFDERVTASDGTELSVDVYRPATAGSYPVLITRTAYDNNRANQRPPASTAPQVPSDRYKLIAAHGYVVVAADVRGRGDSDGVFVPFRHEAADGAEIVQWARSLPESDGKVGVFGSGYDGFCALAAAGNDVDAVIAWSPFGIGEGLPARGGAARLDWLFWLHVVGGRVRAPVDVPDWSSIFASRPLSGMHEALGRADSPWPDWVNHASHDDWFWSALDLGEQLSTTSAPTLLVSGWWDGGLAETLGHWRSLAARESSAGDRLVIGPWDSAGTRRPRAEVGGVAWGPTSVVDPDQMLLEWFDRHLRPGGSTVPREPVRVFVTGRNEWADLDRWPGSDHTQTLWITSQGHANTRVGDGRLVFTTPIGPAVDAFVNDPENPVPWQPGGGSFARSDATRFTLDTAFATCRDDTIVYTAEPTAVPLLIQGCPVVNLFAETQGDDADWVVALEDVFPYGTRTVHLAHGIVRAGTSEAFAPGVVTAFTIAMTDMAHELQPGHALRLVVTSSMFPLYAVNPGSTDYVGSAVARRARHRVHHGSKLPSCVRIPLLTKGQL